MWKCSGRSHLAHRLPQRLPDGVPHGLHVPRARELEAAQAQLGHAMDLLHRGVDVAVRQAREPDLAIGVVAAEVGQPVVVDAEHLLGGLVVVQARGGAEDAEDDLGLDAVELHVLDAEMGVGRAADALLAVLVESRRGHLIDAIVLSRHVLRPGGPTPPTSPKDIPFLHVQNGPSGPSVTYGMRSFSAAEAFAVNRSSASRACRCGSRQRSGYSASGPPLDMRRS